MNLTKELSSLAPIIGICVGWLLGGMTYFFRSHRDDRKILKTLLYYMISTYSLVAKLRPNQLNEAFQIMFEKIPQFRDVEMQGFFNAVVKPLLIKTQVAEVFEGDSLEDIKNSYAQNIKELAKVRPITAFKLADSVNIHTIFELLGKMTAQLTNVAIGSPNQEAEEMLTNFLRPGLIDRTLLGLKSDIFFVAGKIGPVNYFNTRRLFHSLNSSISEEVINTAVEFIQKLIADAETTELQLPNP